jgi:membrane fusion protein, multidrug efflux system
VVIRLRLPNGRAYERTGHLNFANNTVTTNTDTITLRGEIENPPTQHVEGSGTPIRELFDGEFVTVLLEGVQPIEVLAVPRSAVLSDQQGSYVFVVGKDNMAEQRRIQVGQSTTTLAGVIGGLQSGDQVIVEGLQRIRAGAKISPAPGSSQIQAQMKESAGEGGGTAAVGRAHGSAAASGGSTTVAKALAREAGGSRSKQQERRALI